MTIAEGGPMASRQTTTRIPTPNGEFLLALYTGTPDNKEHMALVLGEVAGQEDVLIRVHSECFTGDVLGSLRCDCGEQLERAMQEISAHGSGVILYLRQEGRGIGLLEKLRAYNLQDLGHDTVDANLILGHEADARDYTVAAQILFDLGVRSVQVMTNNPLKIAALQELGVTVTRRIPIEIFPGPDNLSYLRTKALRMSHLLDFATAQDLSSHTNGAGNGHVSPSNGVTEPLQVMPSVVSKFERPAVTISYAQGIDGSIAGVAGARLTISGQPAMAMTHRLRAGHDAILVGIGTALNDDPRLTVRLVNGDDPQPVVVDSTLRLRPDASVITGGHRSPWIMTTERHAPDHRQELERAGATVFVVDALANGHVDLGSMLELLGARGIRSLMVEGGSRIISSFVQARLVDQFVITVAPRLIGGLRVLGDDPASGSDYPRLTNVHYQRLGEDIVLWGRPHWTDA